MVKKETFKNKHNIPIKEMKLKEIIKQHFGHQVQKKPEISYDDNFYMNKIFIDKYGTICKVRGANSEIKEGVSIPFAITIEAYQVDKPVIYSRECTISPPKDDFILTPDNYKEVINSLNLNTTKELAKIYLSLAKTQKINTN